MTAQIRLRDAAGTLRTAARIRARDGTGNLRTIVRIRVRDAAGILRTVWQAVTASLTPSTLSQTGTTATITTVGSVTATSTGTAPYTYSWLSGAPDGITAVSPSAATTTFKRSGMLSGDSFIADFYCVVTDAAGISAQTGGVNVTITRT